MALTEPYVEPIPGQGIGLAAGWTWSVVVAPLVNWVWFGFGLLALGTLLDAIKLMQPESLEELQPVVHGL